MPERSRRRPTLGFIFEVKGTKLAPVVFEDVRFVAELASSPVAIRKPRPLYVGKTNIHDYKASELQGFLRESWIHLNVDAIRGTVLLPQVSECRIGMVQSGSTLVVPRGVDVIIADRVEPGARLIVPSGTAISDNFSKTTDARVFRYFGDVEKEESRDFKQLSSYRQKLLYRLTRLQGKYKDEDLEWRKRYQIQRRHELCYRRKRLGEHLRKY